MIIDKIDDNISFIKSSLNPFSSESFFIKENNITYVFDVGCQKIQLDYINSLKNKVIIISHFHIDHIYNLKNINYDLCYFSSGIKWKYKGVILDKPLNLTQNITLYPITSTHAKGSIAMKYKDLLFAGDLICADNGLYNVQKLYQMIQELENIDFKYFIMSHKNFKKYRKESIIRYLKMIYNKREKNNPYIKE
jgi:ribonuclease BN (tRNA processing enzyme)